MSTGRCSFESGDFGDAIRSAQARQPSTDGDDMHMHADGYGGPDDDDPKPANEVAKAEEAPPSQGGIPMNTSGVPPYNGKNAF